MAVLEDVQRGMGQQRAHDARVHLRDQWVVVPGEDKGLLPDQRQGRQARPASPGEEREEVADTRAESGSECAGFAIARVTTPDRCSPHLVEQVERAKALPARTRVSRSLVRGRLG